jgi:hypothetical protein
MGWADGELRDHPIRWNVASMIRATPHTLLLASSERTVEKSILLEAAERPFRVLGFVHNPSVEQFEASTDARLVQLVKLKLRMKSGSTLAANEIQIRTDDPIQSLVRVRLAWLSNSAGSKHDEARHANGPSRVHTRRVARGDRHRWHTGCAAAAGDSVIPGIGSPRAVPKPIAPDWRRDPRIRRGERLLAPAHLYGRKCSLV